METGYNIRLSQDQNNSTWVQPHVQVIYNGVDASTFADASDSSVRTQGTDNIQSRVGAHLFLNHTVGVHETTYSPYLEAN